MMVAEINCWPKYVIIFFFFFILWIQGGEKGASGQTLCSEWSEQWRAERADACETSESSRKRAVVYLKLLTRQTKKPHITHATNCTYQVVKTVHKTYTIFDLGTADRGARGVVTPGRKPNDNENQDKMSTIIRPWATGPAK